MYESSRRLTGPNLYFGNCGAVLEAFDAPPEVCRRWADCVRMMRPALGWDDAALLAHAQASGAALAFAAPQDQLFTATEVNEWAWLAAVGDSAMLAPQLAPGHAAIWDFSLAQHTLLRVAAAECNPALMKLLAAAAQQSLPALVDEEKLSIGAGVGSMTWPITDLPDAVPWPSLHDIPTALVTGSNGKTTTVRLISAMLTQAGRIAGFNCTDGIFIGDKRVEGGDYSGPGGARKVLRDRQVQVAILETARGGILRRGLAVQRADAAIITNISEDHFGEYGVYTLADLADAKLVVARAIAGDGLLILNADDELLLTKSATLNCPLAWFSLNDEHPQLVQHRRNGGSTCGIRDGELLLHLAGQTHRLGMVRTMPLTVDGSAHYNMANIAGAALVATKLGAMPVDIAAVLGHFGRARRDNPGRLERWLINGVSILLDYAHNPDGLAGLLQVATGLRTKPECRIGLLLGQAGDRDDGAICALARTAAAAQPDLIVLKDMQGYLRGRADGEVPTILRNELLRQNFPEGKIRIILPEVEAAQTLLAWATPGDVLVLPVHNHTAREQIVAVLEQLAAPP